MGTHKPPASEGGGLPAAKRPRVAAMLEETAVVTVASELDCYFYPSIAFDMLLLVRSALQLYIHTC